MLMGLKTIGNGSNSSGMKARHLTTTQLKQVLRERGVEIPPDASRSVLEALKREAEGEADGDAASSDREQIAAALEEARSKRESREELRQNLEAKLAARV